MPKNSMRRRRKAPVSLKDEELLALLSLARRRCLRDWVMILVTYWHGLRAAETCALRVRDFDFTVARPSVMVRRGKGSQGGCQALQEHGNPLLNERAAMEQWLLERGRLGKKGGLREGRKRRAGAQKTQQSTETVAFPAVAAPADPEARVFPVSRCHFWRIVHGYALAVGIPLRKCKTHMLKHTIAKHLIRSGLPVNEVQAWMGWTSLETANWYLMADEEELADRVGAAIRGKDAFRAAQQGALFGAAD
jgi:integrase